MLGYIRGGKDMHDFYISGYSVDFEKSTLHFKIYNNKNIKKDLVFTGVLTYSFKNILKHNQVLDIEESLIDLFLEENEAEISESKCYYWPINYENMEALKKYLLENQYKYIKIFSSWGLNGWILAKEVLWKESEDRKIF